MGSLSLQEVLSSSLAKRRFLLRPAEPQYTDLLGDPTTSIYFGRTQILNVPVYWDMQKLTNPHLAVVGMTGSGKSFFIKTFISRSNLLHKTNALILDWSGEYSSWVQKCDGKIIDFQKSLSFNILDCSPAKNSFDQSSTTPDSHITRLINAFSVIFSLSKNPHTLLHLKNSLESAYKLHKISLKKPLKKQKNIPNITDALKCLKKQKPSKGHDLALLCMEKLCASNSPFLPTKNHLSLTELTTSGLCSINLSTLTSDEHRSLVALILLQFLKEKMRTQEQTQQISPKFIIVADEAWKIAQDENSDLVQIVREGRKYNFSLIVASQNPTDISKTILSNCATLLIFRLLHHDFRSDLCEFLNIHSDVSSQIEKFSVGQALCRFALKNPGPYDGPFIISKIDGVFEPTTYFLEVNDMEFSISKQKFSKKLWRLGLTDSQISQLCLQFEKNDSKLPAHTLAASLLAFGISRAATLSFLRDFSIDDTQLLEIFSQIEARGLGVRADSIANLVIKDAKD